MGDRERLGDEGERPSSMSAFLESIPASETGGHFLLPLEPLLCLPLRGRQWEVEPPSGGVMALSKCYVLLIWRTRHPNLWDTGAHRPYIRIFFFKSSRNMQKVVGSPLVRAGTLAEFTLVISLKKSDGLKYSKSCHEQYRSSGDSQRVIVHSGTLIILESIHFNQS